MVHPGMKGFNDSAAIKIDGELMTVTIDGKLMTSAPLYVTAGVGSV